jgi:steroid delta-isomerase-like uncharacterized protein
MTSDDMNTLIARWTDALVRHDTRTLMTTYADDCVFESLLFGTTIGSRAIESHWDSIWRAFPDWHIDFEDRLIVGDHAVITLAIHGTDTGGFLGQSPTHNSFRTLVVFHLTIKDGRIIHYRSIWDRSGALLQLAGEGHTGESLPLYQGMLDKALLERELAIASEIQQALLPSPLQGGNGYDVAAASVACRAIGGDFFDYFDLPSGGFAFALGDVAGKGPPAALLAGLIQGIFAGRAQLGSGPAETLAHVNEVLVRRAIESRFATILYGTLADGQLTYCNAGHNPPFLMAGSGPRRLDTGGPVVGVFKDTAFEQEAVHLHEGDLLIAFSDGVTEAINNDGEEFGEERLLECIQSNRSLTADDLLKRLFDDVRRFCAGAPQSDDLTALVLRYSG